MKNLPRTLDTRDSDDFARQCYQAILEHYQEFGYPPTRFELSSRLGVTMYRTGVAIRSLESSGLIQVNLATERGIRLIVPEGAVCPCCGGRGILPDRPTLFGWPTGKHRGKKWFADVTPKFLPHENSFRGIALNAVELAILTDLLTRFPNDQPIVTGRRFQEKTGRFPHPNTVRKHRRLLVADGVLDVPPDAPEDLRGIRLTEVEIGVIEELVRAHPSEGALRIAHRFKARMGRAIAKSTVKNYCRTRGFPLRSEIAPKGRPAVHTEIIPIIREISEQHPGWTNVRIAAEVKARTGRVVHRYTIGRYRTRWEL